MKTRLIFELNSTLCIIEYCTYIIRKTLTSLFQYWINIQGICAMYSINKMFMQYWIVLNAIYCELHSQLTQISIITSTFYLYYRLRILAYWFNIEKRSSTFPDDNYFVSKKSSKKIKNEKVKNIKPLWQKTWKI